MAVKVDLEDKKSLKKLYVNMLRFIWLPCLCSVSSMAYAILALDMASNKYWKPLFVYAESAAAAPDLKGYKSFDNVRIVYKYSTIFLFPFVLWPKEGLQPFSFCTMGLSDVGRKKLFFYLSSEW